MSETVYLSRRKLKKLARGRMVSVHVDGEQVWIDPRNGGLPDY